MGLLVIYPPQLLHAIPAFAPHGRPLLYRKYLHDE
jgi:hypothetical protein